MATKYVLKLSKEEREYLSRIAKGTRGRRAIAAWKVVRAKALLKCDEGEFEPAWPDRRIADGLDVTERAIQSWRKKAVLEGPEAALARKTRISPPVPPKVDGRVEAHMRHALRARIILEAFDAKRNNDIAAIVGVESFLPFQKARWASLIAIFREFNSREGLKKQADLLKSYGVGIFMALPWILGRCLDKRNHYPGQC